MPSPWPLETLGEVVDRGGGIVQTGPFGSQLHASDYTTEPGGVPLVMPKDMIGGRLNYESMALVSPKKSREMARHLCRAGDLVLARRGDIGRCAFIHTEDAGVLCGTGALRVAVQGTDLDPQFLFRYFCSEQGRSELAGRTVGATMANLSEGAVRAVPVPVPPLITQFKIGAILAAYDALIDNNNRRIKILEEMARRIYHEWFVDFRYPGADIGACAPSPLGPLPKGWHCAPLDVLCSRITDGAHSSPPTVPTGMPMASVKDMSARRLTTETCRRISVGDFDRLVRQDCLPREGDVLIAKDGSYLKHAFAIREELRVVILSSIAILRPNHRIRPDVLALCLLQPEVKERLKGFVSGVAIPRIVLKDFRKFQIVEPPLDLQMRFEEAVAPMLDLAYCLDKLNDLLQEQRNLLLPRLMAGEVDVADLDVAMASTGA